MLIFFFKKSQMLNLPNVHMLIILHYTFAIFSPLKYNSTGTVLRGL